MRNQQTNQQEAPPETSARQRIVTAARSHFFTFGFRAVTMDDLARELGMSKKTLYAHFPSKVALVQAVLLDKISSVDADLKRLTSDSSTGFPEGLHRFLARVRSHLQEVQPPFVRDLRRDAPEMFKIVEARRRDMVYQYYGKFIGDGQSAGIIREDVPTKLMVEILLAAADAIMNPEKLTDLGIAPQDGFAAIISVILEGVLTERGRATL